MLGASSVQQLAENLGAIELLPKLDDAVVQRIEAALDEHAVPRADP